MIINFNFQVGGGEGFYWCFEGDGDVGHAGQGGIFLLGFENASC